MSACKGWSASILGFKALGALGFRVWGLGFRVLEFRALGALGALGFRVLGFRFRVRVRVKNSHLKAFGPKDPVV